MIPDFTLVLGVDTFHLKQLSLTLPTWQKHKPSLFDHHPLLVLYDKDQLQSREVEREFLRWNLRPRLVAWPCLGVAWDGEEKSTDKWSNPQRAKMLSGFVYVPGLFVRTPYWMKLDTDVVASDNDDWIDERWFKDSPAIVAHRWTFTRPADQMMKLDAWVEANKSRLLSSVTDCPPLNLVPKENATRLGHRRIISWCGFFDTRWTCEVASMTKREDGTYKLPVPSQDGFLWYMATRMGRGIVRPNCKKLGFEHWSTMGNVTKRCQEVMEWQEDCSAEAG